MNHAPSDIRRKSQGKLTGWPRPDMSFGRSMGLNPIRMGILIALALGGTFGGYFLGAHFAAPKSGPAPQAVSKAPAPVAQPTEPAPTATPDETLPRTYEESLPRDIVIEKNGVLKHIALPQPDAEIDLGNGHGPAETAAAGESPTTETAPMRLATTESLADTEAPATEKPEPLQEASLPPAAPPDLIRALPDDIADLQRTRAATLPAWQRYALPVHLNGMPKIVVVMDDLGLDRRRTRETVALSGPLTLSFMAYAEDLGQQTGKARAEGHELMLHVPMEPGSTAINPGPNVLLSGMPSDELRKNIAWNLDQVSGYVGINNHMGSRFTADPDGMRIVTEALKSRGLLFLDSVTSGRTVAHDVARDAGVPFAVRNVFLDHDDDLTAIRHQLRRVEQIAAKTGLAIAIGHPRDKTLAALREWLPTLEDKAFQLVPISAVVRIKTDG